MTAVNDLPLDVTWFETAMPLGPAVGDPERMTWHNFTEVLRSRREGVKDGPGFIPARFRLESDGKHVRRLGKNLISRTAVALDCETNKETGEVLPSIAEAAALVRNAGWAAALYSSHNHTPDAPRGRIVLPLTEEIDPELPAVEAVANQLDLWGVTDRSKVGAASLFYCPSSEPGELDRHQTIIIDGEPIRTDWINEVAGSLLAERRAEQERIAAAAQAEAEARRQAKINAGFDPADSVIEKVRPHLDLEQILLSHGYEKSGDRFRHPNSSSGGFGAKLFGGEIPRIYSHNATDPLHAANLPPWCGGKALDAVDVVTILAFAGDRTKALRALAERYGLTRTRERKTLARLIFRLVRERAAQEKIETAAFAEGARLGLSADEVCQISHWVAAQRAVADGVR